MDSNTHSTQDPGGWPDGLAGLAAAVDGLAAQELHGLSDAALAGQVLGLRRLVDRLEGHWLQQLAAVDGRGAAGADQGTQAPSTAAWLRTRLRLGAGAAASSVRTARALFRGPLAVTAAALTGGELSVAHARVLAYGTQELPEQVTVAAELVLVEAAAGLDPPRLRRVLGHLCLVADPDAADRHTEVRYAHRASNCIGPVRSDLGPGQPITPDPRPTSPTTTWGATIPTHRARKAHEARSPPAGNGLATTPVPDACMGRTPSEPHAGPHQVPRPSPRTIRLPQRPGRGWLRV